MRDREKKQNNKHTLTISVFEKHIKAIPSVRWRELKQKKQTKVQKKEKMSDKLQSDAEKEK